MSTAPIHADAGMAETGESSMFDSLARLVPDELQAAYYRVLAHTRTLSPDDEMLRILEAMGILALLTRHTPKDIADERERIQAMLDAHLQFSDEAQEKMLGYVHFIEGRLAELPSEIEAGLDPQQIAIYTSQPDLPILAQELLNEIRLNASTVEALTLDPNGTVLTGKTTRICFFNKVDSLGVPKQHIVAVKDLPAQLLQEFAMLTEGFLATYAVTSIAAVRRAIHSLIAVFAKELDGAYVAHRCSIPHPEEATDFARELVISEISNLISVDQASDQCTGTPIIQSWIDHIAASGRKFSTADAELSVDLLKDFVANGSSAIDGSSSKQSVPNNPGAHPSKTKAIGASNLAEVFYDSPKEAFERNAEFSRLNTFKREVLRGPIARNGWVPTLSLGTVVRVVSDHPQTKNIAAEFPFQYLVCVQPRCDSVRLKGEISFPFQIAMFNETKFNLVVNDDAMVNQTLCVTYKPRDVVMRKFIPESSSETVKARKTEANQFVFTDVTGRSFAWVGDIKDLKAQKDASELAASVHRVGVDEFEWLRQKSK